MKKNVVFSGGLGNQMFQYAFVLSLRDRGISCIVDTSRYDLHKMHNGFELDRIFNLEEKIEKQNFIHVRIVQLLGKFRPRKFVYKDRIYQYCEDVYHAKQPYLFGDWINENYFNNLRYYVQKKFQFTRISSHNKDKSQEIINKQSVSIHIRRGDYLKLPNYCVCDEKYYFQAIKIILEKVENPIFYIFSDDPSWANKFMSHMNLNYQIIDWNQNIDSFQDMYLMTQCKHNIIANSTFSWWGAWLNMNKNKIVISPKKWFHNSNNNANCKDWILVPIK